MPYSDSMQDAVNPSEEQDHIMQWLAEQERKREREHRVEEKPAVQMKGVAVSY